MNLTFVYIAQLFQNKFILTAVFDRDADRNRWAPRHVRRKSEVRLDYQSSHQFQSLETSTHGGNIDIRHRYIYTAGGVPASKDLGDYWPQQNSRLHNTIHNTSLQFTLFKTVHWVVSGPSKHTDYNTSCGASWTQRTELVCCWALGLARREREGRGGEVRFLRFGGDRESPGAVGSPRFSSGGEVVGLSTLWIVLHGNIFSDRTGRLS